MIFNQVLIAQQDTGFVSVGSAVASDTIIFTVTNLTKDYTYQWLVKEATTDPDNQALAGDNGTLTSDIQAVSFSLNITDFSVGETYYFALREFNQSLESQEVVQVSFSIAQNAILGQGTNPLNIAPLFLPNFTTAERDAYPTGTNALIIYNTTTDQVEQYDPTTDTWGAFGNTINWGDIGGTLSAQTDLNSALGSKQATLVSGTNIKTVNGTSVLGSGDLTLDADDIDDTSTTHKFVTSSDITKLSNLSGTNTGDVTVLDSTEIDFTLTGQQITASIKTNSIDETKLDTSTNASLDLADTALQPSAIGVTVQGYSSVLANTTASFTTTDESKLDGIEAGAEVNNISDVNATDLTDGGDTTLHIHDGRYYTESEVNALLGGKVNDTGDTMTGTLTITGAGLVVDSADNTLVVDATNNRVGVGTASPSQALDVTGSIVVSSFFRSNSGLSNNTSTNNSAVRTSTTGTLIDRNINDTNPVLRVQNANATSTGDIVRLLDSSSNVLFAVDTTGQLTMNGRSSSRTLNIVPQVNQSSSNTTGGALRVDNTLSTGAGVVIYSNAGTGRAGRLVDINIDNAGFNTAGVHIDYAGTANVLEVNNTGTGSSNQALNVVSTNSSDTAVGISGQESAKGTVKITHTKPTGSDSGSSVLSLRANGSGTASHGIFFDAEQTGGTTGDLILMRQNGVDTFRVDSSGVLQSGSVPQARVTNLATDLATKTDKLITTNRQTASYTLVLADADKLVEMNVGSANNLTVPLNSSVAFSIGTQIIISQYGAGQTTIVPTSGVTLRSNGARLKLTGQYSMATLIKIGTDEWYVSGDTTV